MVLHFQPQVDLLSGMVVGSEALVRWQHPEQGLLGPERFIARAEETGQIHELTMRVFDLALKQVAAWQHAGVELPPVAVNLSPAMLTDPDLPLRLAALLERHRVSATDVVIEMTESSMATNADEAQRMLARLDELGFRMSLDDFGTGYSSLARLDQMPLTEMKIDRSFVARMAAGGTEAPGQVTMIDLAHDLGMRVVGEGVETANVAAILADAGCDLAQGFYYARPMEAAELAEWLDSPKPAQPGYFGSASISFSSRLSTLPVALRGSSSRNQISRGTLKLARLDFTCFLSSSSSALLPLSSTTNARRR